MYRIYDVHVRRRDIYTDISENMHAWRASDVVHRWAMGISENMHAWTGKSSSLNA